MAALTMSTAVQTRPKQRSYTVEEIDRGLTELALCNGNRRLAHKRLKRQLGDQAPTASALDGWTRNGRRGRYLEIQAEVLPRIHEAIATEAESIALEAAELQRDLVKDFDQKRESLTPKEVSTAARDWATVFGISVDKSSLLRGRPTQIVEHRSADEVLRGLAQRIPGMVVDGTAEEIADGESPVVERDGETLALSPDVAEQRPR